MLADSGVACDDHRARRSGRTSEAEAELDLLFEKNIRPDSRILELAPGTGINLDRLRRVSPEFQSYLGIDLSKEMLTRAQRRAKGDTRVQLRVRRCPRPHAGRGHV